MQDMSHDQSHDQYTLYCLAVALETAGAAQHDVQGEVADEG